MRGGGLWWALAGALVVIPQAAWSRCGGSGSGGHVHDAQAEDGGEQKTRRAIRQLLAREESRDLLMAAILADEELLWGLVERVVETEEGRGLVAEALEKGDKASAAITPARPSRPQAKPAMVSTCPMHPEVVSSKPGKCHKCGMTLQRSQTAAAQDR